MKRAIFATMLGAMMMTAPAHAEWEPNGPIKLWIGFGAGGGTDIQARMLAEEIEKLKGWRIIPENRGGAGGAVMAASLKDVAPDGQTIGLAINTTFDFATLTSDNLDFEQFTYITTTAASQMAVLARADSGWKTLDDMIAAAKGGDDIVWANYGALTQGASEVIARHYDINVSHLRGEGGKSGVDALVAQDANVAWAGGAQRPLVAAGELVILASAEDQPLEQAPEGKTLRDLGIDYNFGFKFVLAGPAGMDEEASAAIAEAVGEVLANPDSETYKFITKQYPPAPVVIQGDELTALLKSNLEANKNLLEVMAQ